MEALGRDVLLRILGHVACRDVLALACTCREMASMMRVRASAAAPSLFMDPRWGLPQLPAAWLGAQVSLTPCVCSLPGLPSSPPFTSGPPPPTRQDDEVWRELAEHKWGPAVRQLARVQPGQWAAWVKHRLGTASSPLSPLDLVQVGHGGGGGGLAGS